MTTITTQPNPGPVTIGGGGAAGGIGANGSGGGLASIMGALVLIPIASPSSGGTAGTSTLGGAGRGAYSFAFAHCVPLTREPLLSTVIGLLQKTFAVAEAVTKERHSRYQSEKSEPIGLITVR